VKGAFLDADKAFEVINGMRTVELRMLQQVHQHAGAGARAGPRIRRSTCDARRSRATRTSHCASELMFLGLPAPLFTIDFETEIGAASGASPSSASSIASSRRSACR
jgi:O-acetylhomoserine (thiol)-lyase